MDTGKGTVSLKRLIEDIERHRSKVTRQWFVQRGNQNAETEFDEFTSESCRSHLSREVTRCDLATLDEANETVIEFANEHVTHLSKTPRTDSVVGTSVDEAIETLNRVMRRYYLLINYSTLVDDDPIILENWTAVFRQSWLIEGQWVAVVRKTAARCEAVHLATVGSISHPLRVPRAAHVEVRDVEFGRRADPWV